MKFFKTNQSGFTLVESLIVIGIIIILAGATVGNFLTKRNQVTLDSTTQDIVATLREAGSRATAQEGATGWGVHFENSTITAPFYALFKTSYASANTVGYYRLPVGVGYATSSIPQGSSLDVTFTQLSGLPSATSSITLNLTLGASNGSVTTSTTIIVGTTGIVSF